MLVCSFAEIFSIASVLPLLKVLADPEQVLHFVPLQFFFSKLGISAPNQLLLPCTIFFCLTVLFASFIRLVLLWASTRLSFAAGADFSADIYRRTLYQPYVFHKERNSSEVISGITTKVNTVIFLVISPMLTLINSCIFLGIIFLGLLWVAPLVSISIFGTLLAIYSFIIYISRHKLLFDGQIASIKADKIIQILQEGLGSIRDILLDGTQELYSATYNKTDSALRRAQASAVFIGAFPRYIVEGSGTIIIALVAYFLGARDSSLTTIIPVFGVVVLGAQRLIPLVQQAYNSWANIQTGKEMLKDTIALLKQPLLIDHQGITSTPLALKSTILINNVSFSYEANAPLILKNINLEIKRGAIIGFIGKTGGGKSTLLDIIMGLLKPTSGKIEVDTIPITQKNLRSWQSNIAHVPQNVFLSDASIAENIAFGVDRDLIDINRVIECTKAAHIDDEVNQLPQGYQAIVGEGGMRLSGGQRQRIGIARALYKKSEIIIFDEATSALDEVTEARIMQSIYALSGNITILIVAHRVSTLKNCTQIVELKDGQISRVYNYLDI
jgi:ATP-binding cassette subfamily B protein